MVKQMVKASKDGGGSKCVCEGAGMKCFSKWNISSGLRTANVKQWIHFLSPSLLSEMQGAILQNVCLRVFKACHMSAEIKFEVSGANNVQNQLYAALITNIQIVTKNYNC